MGHAFKTTLLNLNLHKLKSINRKNVFLHFLSNREVTHGGPQEKLEEFRENKEQLQV